MSLKRSSRGADGNGASENSTSSSQPNEPAKFRENAEVNAKIDSYIQNNPKEWGYIQSMSRERLERSLVLQAIQKLDRRERMRVGILKKLDENPELKEAYRALVKNLPADQQEKAMASIAARTMRTIAPTQRPQEQAQGARV